MPGILGGKRSPAETPRPSHRAVAAAEYPAAEESQRPPPEPGPTPVAGARHTGLLRNRRLRKKILTPAILAARGSRSGIVARMRRPCDGALAAADNPAAEESQRPPPELGPDPGCRGTP